MKAIIKILLVLLVLSVASQAFSVTLPTATIIPVHLRKLALLQKVNLRCAEEYRRVRKATKTGKLTQTEEKNLIVQLKAIEQQEKSMVKQNGNKSLTDTQAAQLNQQLNELSKSLPLL